MLLLSEALSAPGSGARARRLSRLYLLFCRCPFRPFGRKASIGAELVAAFPAFSTVMAWLAITHLARLAFATLPIRATVAAAVGGVPPLAEALPTFAVAVPVVAEALALLARSAAII